MKRLLFAAVLAGLALLIPVVMGQFWVDTDPPPADSESREAEPAGDPVAAEQPSVATDPPPADSIRIMKPWAFYRSSELLGKVLLPERTDAPPDDGYAGQTPFLGPQACAECHRGRVEGFLQTSHAHSSQVANADTVLGSFQAPHNRLAVVSRTVCKTA